MTGMGKLATINNGEQLLATNWQPNKQPNEQLNGSILGAVQDYTKP